MRRKREAPTDSGRIAGTMRGAWRSPRPWPRCAVTENAVCGSYVSRPARESVHVCRVASGVGAVGVRMWQTLFRSGNVGDAEAAGAHGCLRRQLSSWPGAGWKATSWASARSAVMVRGVGSVGDRSFLLLALRTSAPIRAPPQLRPPLPRHCGLIRPPQRRVVVFRGP